jgi:hypothetical protein
MFLRNIGSYKTNMVYHPCRRHSFKHALQFGRLPNVSQFVLLHVVDSDRISRIAIDVLEGLSRPQLVPSVPTDSDAERTSESGNCVCTSGRSILGLLRSLGFHLLILLNTFFISKMLWRAILTSIKDCIMTNVIIIWRFVITISY